MIRRALSLVVSTGWLLCACPAVEDPATVLCEGDYEPTEADFTCAQTWHAVGNLRLTNRCGKLEEALALARDPKRHQRYPLGTLVTLNTGEAMAKRGHGYDQDFNDWEYFTLNLSPTGASIASRGRREVKNDLGSCLECHQGARDQDFLCLGQTVCDPLPVSGDVLRGTQELDPRCAPP